MSPGLGALPEDYSGLQYGLVAQEAWPSLQGLHYMAHEVTKQAPSLLSHPGGLEAG